MQPEVKVHVTRNGTQYALFAQTEIISDEIRRNQYWNTYNLEIADIVLSENKGNRVIDVGSGLGGFTVPLAIKYMKSHIFEAFEPVPAINQQLNANALLNRLYNVRCYRFGVADRNEVIDHAIFDLPVPNEIDVYELRTLDDFRFGNVALVKITVSGMELEVLKGSGKIIENNQTPPLMIECWNDDWYKERKDAMIEVLQQYGYKQVLVRRGFIYAFNDINLSKKVEQRLSEQVPGSKVMFK
jgi:FkbM family methyltransferase